MLEGGECKNMSDTRWQGADQVVRNDFSLRIQEIQIGGELA